MELTTNLREQVILVMQAVIQKLLSLQKIRFGMVGMINMLIDTSFYTLLVYASVGVIVANYVSTTVAVVAGHFLHRRLTFRASAANPYKSLTQFMLVTLFGLWVLQPIVIYCVHHAVEQYHLVIPGLLVIVVPKLCAIGLVMFWNYYWYSRVVFKSFDIVSHERA